MSISFLFCSSRWLFLIDPNTLNDRLQICITAFLALVAFNFVIAETLPKINHSTYLTHFFGVNYGAISLAALESGISFLIDKYLPENGFNTAKILDWSTMGFSKILLFLYFTSYHREFRSCFGANRVDCYICGPSKEAQPQTKIRRRNFWLYCRAFFRMSPLCLNFKFGFKIKLLILHSSMHYSFRVYC